VRRIHGKSFAEAEEFALSVYRQYVLQLPSSDVKAIIQKQFTLFEAQASNKTNMMSR